MSEELFRGRAGGGSSVQDVIQWQLLMIISVKSPRRQCQGGVQLRTQMRALVVKITDQTNDLSMCGVRSKVPALSSRACQGLEKEGESKTERKM